MLGVKIAQIAAEIPAKVGVAVRLVETGELSSYHGTDHFPMQSVYKLLIALAVLDTVDAGKLTLSHPILVTARDITPPSLYSPIAVRYPKGNIRLSVEYLLRMMVSESDCTASDVFLRVLTADQIMGYLRRNRIGQVAVVTTEKQMAQGERVQYRNWATPLAITEVLCKLQQGKLLSAQNRKRLIRYMTESPTGKHRLKGLLPAGTLVAHKTGSSHTVNGKTAATNDAGLITLPNGQHLAITVFVSDSTATEALREATIAKIARSAWDFYVKT